ncbi:MAG: ABC transporter permease [Planctomycetaceae bacterium]|nr:ABC transporter permease [Planctomycetaceae bacterium]
MTRHSLLLQTLLYHWRTNLAVLLGVIAGTAVIAGALVVGDSVRGSLRDMMLVRLGKIDYVLNGPRFVREQLSTELADALSSTDRFAAVAPAIVLTCSIERPSDDGIKILSRAGGVNLYGVDARVWELTDHGDSAPPVDDEVLLSHGLARQLGVAAGDAVTLAVELPSDIPRDSLLGKRDETAVQVPLIVKAVLSESSGVGRLGLYPNQQLPRNAFVGLQTLQDRLGLAGRGASRRDPRSVPARVNALFVAGRDSLEGRTPSATETAVTLNASLSRVWKLDDFHLRVVSDSKSAAVSLESERMILDQTVAAAARKVAGDLAAPVSPVLVYIANEISVAQRADGSRPAAHDEHSPHYSRYSVVAGIDRSLYTSPDAAPFGPYIFEGPPPAGGLGHGALAEPDGVGEILINDWLAADLQAGIGDTLRLTYHVVGSHGELPEVEKRFLVRGIVKLDGTIAANRQLTPEVRGITDVKSFDEWDAPFPMEEKVTARDDAYWSLYRATPKAFLGLEEAQSLWRNRYGDLTSIRVAAAPGLTLPETQERFTQSLLQSLPTEAVGLAFQPVKYQGLQAASGTTDFGGLFFLFSFFLILSASILIGLLFRLGIERRATQIGVQLATGFTRFQVRCFLLVEALIVVFSGVMLGLFAAASYASLMIYGLKTWWIGAIGTRFLEVHLVPASLAIGALISVAVALGSILWGMRGLLRISPRSLLAGVTQVDVGTNVRRTRRRGAGRLAAALAGFALVSTIAVLAGWIPAVEAFSGFSWPTIVFFLVGMALLAAGLAFFAAWLDADKAGAVRGSGLAGLARLGFRNAARHRSRSLLSTGLISAATFLIVAIAAGHRNPSAELPDRNSGNGGFTLVAESSVPVLYDLNTAEGREKLGLGDDASRAVLQSVNDVVGFSVNPGENASCLNIYRTSQPTILGVSPEMFKRGGFKFVGAGSGSPWSALHDSQDGIIPVIGDMNTLQYSLHVGLGQTLELRDEFQKPFTVRIAGILDSSVFQGVLMMDGDQFQRLYPSRFGAQYFLIDVPLSKADAVTDLLESKLAGFDAERVADRLANFLAVQNTYLSTFQALGGLGLLLGTVGLSTVMLRNVLERRSELALLRAVGFRDGAVAWLVVCENALLLGWGLACGSISALFAMLPHLLSTGADVPWRDVFVIVAAVFAAGMIAALAAVRSAVRTPVLATLRGE